MLVLALTADEILLVVGVLVVLVFLLVFAIIGQFLNLWIQAKVSGVHVTMFHLMGMRLRKVDLRTVVLSLIRAHKAGLDLSLQRLEAHYLAGGRVVNVINAMIAAKGADIRLGWDQATKMDLGGTDVFQWVQDRARRNRGEEVTPVEPEPAPAPPPPPPQAKPDIPPPPDRFFLDSFLGMEGTAHTALFASGVGRVKIAGKVLPAIASNSAEIDRGTPIRVTGVHPSGVLFVEAS